MIDREDLKAFVDGELSALEMSRIREAMLTDRELAAEVEEIERLTHTIRAVAPVPAVVGLEGTLAALGKPRIPARRIAWPLAIAAAIGFLLVVTVPVFSTAKFAAKRTSAQKSSVALLRNPETSTFGTRSPVFAPSVNEGGEVNSDLASVAPVDKAAAVAAKGKTSSNKVDALPMYPKKTEAQESYGYSRKSRVDIAFAGEDHKASPSRSLSAASPNLNGLEPAGTVKREEPQAQIPLVAGAAESTLTVEVDSLELAQAKVANLVGHLGGTVSASPSTINGSGRARELVVSLPVEKAPEAVSIIRSVATAAFRRPGYAPQDHARMGTSLNVQGLGGGAGATLAQAADQNQQRLASGLGGFGGGAGQGGGGRGGGSSDGKGAFGGAGGASGGPGGPPANPDSRQGAALKANRTSGPEDEAAGRSQTSVASGAAVMLKKRPVPLRKIVVILRQRSVQKPKPDNHR